MIIAIQLRLDVARDIHQIISSELTPTINSSSNLLNTTEALGVSLKPMHPGIDDPGLIPYFMIEVEDYEFAQHLIQLLQEFKEVEAAYIKPEDEPP